MKHLKSEDVKTVYLHPGEVCISLRPRKVSTVLGSCVSVTLFHPRSKMGAICHGTLPRCRSAQKECATPCIEAFKFMDCAILYMLRSFRDRGITNSEIEIKVFGGADTLMSRSSNTIGSKNIKTTIDILKKEKLHVLAADVGDSFGRKIIFYSHTGEIYLKRLKPADGARTK